MRIAVFAGDGIGPEVTEQAVRVLESAGPARIWTLSKATSAATAYRKHGHPLPERDAGNRAFGRCHSVRRGG